MGDLFGWMKDNWKIVLGIVLLIAAVLLVPDAFAAIFKGLLNTFQSCQGDIKNIDFGGN